VCECDVDQRGTLEQRTRLHLSHGRAPPHRICVGAPDLLRECRVGDRKRIDVRDAFAGAVSDPIRVWRSVGDCGGDRVAGANGVVVGVGDGIVDTDSVLHTRSDGVGVPRGVVVGVGDGIVDTDSVLHTRSDCVGVPLGDCECAAHSDQVWYPLAHATANCD
jgi:hypothetical protein